MTIPMPIKGALALAAAAVAGCATNPTSGQQQSAPAPSPTRGHALAQSQCAMCHAVEGELISPRFAAPPFRRLKRLDADQWLPTLEGMSRGVHDAMPMFTLSPQATDDLRAYIATLP